MALQHLDFQTLGVPSDRQLHAMSVLTSTKIRVRVSAAMNTLFPSDASTATDTVVAFSAKGPAANKLVSIVEIVKRESAAKQLDLKEPRVESSRGQRTDAILFQYSIVRELQEDQKALDDARQKSEAGRQAKRKRETDLGDEEGSNKKQTVTTATEASKSGEAVQGKDVATPQASTDQDYFETLQAKGKAEHDIIERLEGKPRRETPTMIVFLSRKSMKSIRETYGEQWI